MLVTLLPTLCAGMTLDGGGVFEGGLSFDTLGAGIPVGALPPPDFSTLSIAAADVNKYCIDANADGVCEAFRHVAIPPMDVSGFPVTDLGTNPTPATIMAAVNAGSGCRAFTFDGTSTFTGVEMILTRDCVHIDWNGNGSGANFFRAAGTTLNNLGSVCGNYVALLGFCGGAAGASQSWSAGFAIDTTQVSVADASQFDVYDPVNRFAGPQFVAFEMNSTVATCPAHIQRDPNTGRSEFFQLSRVVAKDEVSDTLTIWPPLMMDYANPDCGNRTATPYVLSHGSIGNVGFSDADPDEGCTFPSVDSPSGCLRDSSGYVLWHQAQGFAVGNDFQNSLTEMVRVRKSFGVWIEGNNFENPEDCRLAAGQGAGCGGTGAGFQAIQFLSGMVNLGEGATLTTVVNNSAPNVSVFVNFLGGAAGAIVSDNWCDNGIDKCFMAHGHYARHLLLSRNDVDTIHLDRQWGEDFWMTVYRNEVHPSYLHFSQAGMISLRDGTTSGPIGERVSWIGNYSDTRMGGASNAPFDLADDSNTPGAHMEDNWTTGTLLPGSCSTCTPSGFAALNFSSPTQPASLATEEGPVTIWRIEGREIAHPDYWSQEAFDFYDVHNGIGAYNANPESLMTVAERRYLGLPNTPCGAGGAGC